MNTCKITFTTQDGRQHTEKFNYITIENLILSVNNFKKDYCPTANTDLNSYISNLDIIQQLTEAATKAGLVFKAMPDTLNGVEVYQLETKDTGRVLVYNYKIETAYADMCKGFFSSWDGSTFVCGTRKNG